MTDSPPSSAPPAPPRYWTRTMGNEGGEVLSYAVRGGRAQWAVSALGLGCILVALWGAAWLLADGGLTVAGILFLLLVPGGTLLFGIYCLNIAHWARQDYLLDRHGLSARYHALFGGRRQDIPRQAITAIRQHYTPPGESASSRHPGDWVTFVSHRDAVSGKNRDFALAGMHTPEEARWLGPVLARWADVPLNRNLAEGYEEADPAERLEP